jgi:hypothetical protein
MDYDKQGIFLQSMFLGNDWNGINNNLVNHNKMKEKIIEILEKWTDANSNDYSECADEILALGWYPKEFVEYMPYMHKHSNNKYCIWIDSRPKWFTLDELYKYWQQNIKDK